MTTAPEPFTVEIPASELPESIVARFHQRPAATARFSVTVEPVETVPEKFEALRQHIQEGLDDMDAGRLIDGATAFATLKAGCRAL